MATKKFSLHEAKENRDLLKIKKATKDMESQQPKKQKSKRKGKHG